VENKIINETAKAKRAYGDYLNLGINRSLQALVEMYQQNPKASPTTSLRCLKTWSSNHHWVSRVEAHETAITESALEQTVQAKRREYEHALQEFSHHYKSAGRESFASAAIAIQEIRQFLNREDFKITCLDDAVKLSHLLRNLMPYADFWGKSLAIDRLLENQLNLG
jgi:hypothetical protein